MNNASNFHYSQTLNSYSSNCNYLIKRKTNKRSNKNKAQYSPEHNNKTINNTFNTVTDSFLPKKTNELNQITNELIDKSFEQTKNCDYVVAIHSYTNNNSNLEINSVHDSILNSSNHIKCDNRRIFSKNNNNNRVQTKKNCIKPENNSINHNEIISSAYETHQQQMFYRNQLLYLQNRMITNHLQTQTHQICIPNLYQSLFYQNTHPQIYEEQMKKYIYNQQVKEGMQKHQSEILHNQKQIEEDVINTPVFILKLQIDPISQPPRTFIVKKNDDLILSLKQFCTNNKIKDYLFYPILSQIVIGMNRLYYLFNSNLNQENQIYINQIKQFYLNTLYNNRKQCISN